MKQIPLKLATVLVSLLFFSLVFSCKPKQVPADVPQGIALLPISSVKQTIALFSEAVQRKDTALLKQSVSPSFAVATVTWPSSRNNMQIIFERTTAIDSIVSVADSVVAFAGSFKQKIMAKCYLQGKEPVETNITFDGRDGKILYVDYFDSLYGIFRDKPAQLAAVLPIEQDDNGSIIIHLKLNKYDQALRFLFDSGADGMAVSTELAGKAGVKVSRSQSTSVVGGNMKITVSSGNTVHLDTLSIPNQNIALFEKMRGNIDGIIGLNLAKHFIVNVNFDEQKMYLYRFGSYEYEAEGETEAITVPAGVIVIPGYLNLIGKDTVQGNFVFDTGAAYYFMGFSPFVRNNRLLVSGFKPEEQSSTVSMGITTPVFEGKAKEFGFGETIKQTDMPVSLQGSTANSDWKPGADASVGIKLISKYNFTINLLEKEVHFTPRAAK